MVIAIFLLLLAVLVFIFSLRLRQQSGLPQGRVVYSDSGVWQRNQQALFSKQYQLVGKPDYLVRDKNDIVPVEVKSGLAPPQPRPGHVLQLAAYCLLVEENYGLRPRYGIVQYADKQFAVDYTAELQAKLLYTMQAMRADLTRNASSRNHNDPWRCAACGVRAACDERLET
jgi:CRISPR-associated exonuclease Cas4